MKSKKLLMVAAVGLLAVTGLVSCNEKTEEDTTIDVQFVPSRDPGELATLAKNLEPILNKAVTGYTFNITTGTSYAATTEAMLSSQIDVGFLTASGYAEATLKHKGEIEVSMTSVRKGYKVQTDDYPGDVDKQIKAMNGEISGYTYLGDQSTTDVNWYTSQLCVAKQYYVDKNGDGKIDIKDMAGLTIARQGQTSGAGYLRPLKYLNDYGMKMVDELTDATTQIKGLYIKGYDAALSAMLTGEVAGFWGFTDVRYSNGYNKEGNTAWYHNSKIFEDYPCVAITDGIYNDTISVRSGLSDNAKAAVKTAFKAAVKDGDKDTEGTGAYYLYNLYSHTGYTDAKDSDFDGEREFYQYCVDNNLL
ncbi:MAG: PhnD/SsuA/transferrin family substrate-binding protein [Bacilli bacterium]